jgi:hypothetical protein
VTERTVGVAPAPTGERATSGSTRGRLAGGGLTAEATARLVLSWAATYRATPRWDPVSARPATDALPPPSGQLRRPAQLGEPRSDTVEALGDMVRRTTARLGAGVPPFGDIDAVGPGALLLAAAVGGRRQVEPATLLAEAVPPPRLTVASGAAGWADATARHGVVDPFLRHTTASGAREPLVETLLEVSPLTALLHRPPAARLADATTRTEEEAAMSLLSRPRGASVLAAALAGWATDDAVLNWRTALLAALSRPDRHPEVVVEVYLVARLRYGPAWDAALLRARNAFLSRRHVPDAVSIATVRYWLPLANLNRGTDLVRRCPLLLESSRSALALVRAHRRALTAVAA